MAKLPRKISVKAFSISLLFFFSSIGASVLIGPAGASPGSPAALAAAPLSSLEANWAEPNGNAFNTNYNPQNRINSSNAQYLGLSWLFPLPTHPTALLNVGGGLGVDAAPLIINGTVYFVTQFGQVFALNAANGNVLWTDVLPISPNSTQGLKGVGAVSLHMHDGAEWFTTKLFGGTPTFWVVAPDIKVYAINALTGKYELNFTYFKGVDTVDGNNPGAVDPGGAAELAVDQNRGIVITSINSGSSAATGRCIFRGWNVLVTPPQLMWTAFCTPPQPGSNIPVNPNWDVQQIATMKGAYIFRGYGRASLGGYGGPEGAVDLKGLSPAQLNSTLYNDWGYANQSPACMAITGGASTGSTASGWGGPWVLGTGPSSGLAYVSTNNKDPYSGPCTPGPDLWSESVLALNETNGQWVWGFQASAHDLWDYDCSWWQAMGNETVNGVNTQVLWKTCKHGYLFELNPLTGALVYSWTPPTSYIARCYYCFMHDPLNATEMSWPFMNPSLQPTLVFPGPPGELEDEAAYSPTLNYLFLAAEQVPFLVYNVPFNSTNYKTNAGLFFAPPPGQGNVVYGAGAKGDNTTVFAVNAATGQMVWSHFIPTQGYRGGVSTSGNIVFLALSSGDLLMLDAKTGATVKDYFIGGPLNVVPSVGATASGQMQVILPITAGIITWGTGVPGDIVALSLQNLQTAPTTNTVTSTAAGPTVTTTVGGSSGTVTVTSTVGGSAGTVTVTSTAPGTTTGTGVDTTTLYGVAAVAVIFIIATGYLAMRGRKPGP
jgi:glucose dehydrogenase